MAEAQKVAIVTGAGTGIGKAAAIALAKAGYAVALAGRRKEPLEETAKEIKGKSLVVPTNVGDPASVKALFAKVKEQFGRLDLLFNNAGMGAPPVPLEELTYDQWSAVIAANLTGPFLCTQEAFKLMKAQTPRGGRIINNGSITALTKSSALDGRTYDIACGQIDIGNAATPMTERMKTGVLQPNGTMMPEPRMDVEDVAKAVVHMASLPLDSNVLFMTIMATKM